MQYILALFPVLWYDKNNDGGAENGVRKKQVTR